MENMYHDPYTSLYTYEEIKLKLHMRKLWEDHSMWLRMYNISLLANLPDLDKITERLIKTQESIGNCVKPFFGDIATDNLTSLLKDHVTITGDLLKTIKGRDEAKILSLEGDEVTNIENIATLLSTTNSCYSKDELIDMFNTHLILEKYQFIARMSGDYTVDIMYYDMGLHHIMMMSDYITHGIIDKFFEEQII